MAETESGQEKTEAATEKRLKEAREKGQTPRSRDLNTLIILITGSASLLLFGQHVANELGQLSTNAWQLARADIYQDDYLLRAFATALLHMLVALAPILLMLVLAALLGPILLGGWLISSQALLPKFSRLNPLQGLKRMFASRGLVELGKALLKFLVVGGVSLSILKWKFPEILTLDNMPFRTAFALSLRSLAWSFFWLCSTLLLIAALDVPYQLWEYYKNLRMSKQEVKDEYRDTEGKPEVKSQIRRMQQELAQSRMMESVPAADVVVTNPEHYSVALRYHEGSHEAPKVVAKGQDLVAFAIRNVAREHHVPLVQAPRLARAIYRSTRINEEIPHALYVAVAQVLAYVFQLKRRNSNVNDEPHRMDDLPIPDEFADQ